MSSLKDKRSSRTDLSAAPAPAAVVIGRLAGLTEDGSPLVLYPGGPDAAVPAMATARYHGAAAGAPVALMFVDGDPARPIAIGLVADGLAGAAAADAPEDRLTLTAAREIVLQCGRASIVLTRAGKVLVRGAYVSLRSSGMQRITGASVQIN